MEPANHFVIADCEALRCAIRDALDMRLLRIAAALGRSIHGRTGAIHAIQAGRKRVFLPFLTSQLDVVLLISHLLGHHFTLGDLLMPSLTLRLL